jgi:peptide/nickel transport system permease protein
MDSPKLRAILFFPRRIVWLILTFLAMTVIIFAFMRVGASDLTQVLGQNVSPEQAEMLEQQLGLDQPVWRQYTRYLSGVLRGEYGTSLQVKRPVDEVISQRAPATWRLLGLATLVGMVLSVVVILLGSLVLWLRDKVPILGAAFQRGGQIGLTPAVAMPVFLLGLFLLYLFGLKLRWLPVAGLAEIGSEGFSLKHAVLPVLTLATLPAYLVARSVLGEIAHYRANVVEQRGPFLIHTVLSFFRYGLLQLIGMLGGVIFVELVFSLPGIGRLLVQAIFGRDYPLLVGLISTFLIWAVVIRLVADLVQGIDGFMLSKSQSVTLDMERPTPSEKPTYAKVLSIIWIALCILLVVIPLLQGGGGLLTDSDALAKTTLTDRNLPPGGKAADGTVYAWGTDALGRDVRSRVRYALGVDLASSLVIMLAVLIPALLGGLLAGFLAKKGKLWADLVEDVVIFPVEVLTAIPGVVLLAFILAMIGPGLKQLLIWLTLVFLLPRSVRLAREGWISAAPEKAVWLRLLGIALGVLVLGTGLAVITQPALGFLGLGATPPWPDVGRTLSEGMNRAMMAPHVVLLTGQALLFAAFGWFLLADTLLSKFGIHKREAWLELNR